MQSLMATGKLGWDAWRLACTATSAYEGLHIIRRVRKRAHMNGKILATKNGH